MKWVRSGDFDRIMRGEYRRRDEKVDPRAEAGDAFAFYSERFRAAFRELGESVTKVGRQVGTQVSGFADLAGQASTWMKNRRGGSGADTKPEGRQLRRRFNDASQNVAVRTLSHTRAARSPARAATASSPSDSRS
jgi:hypothetical protein